MTVASPPTLRFAVLGPVRAWRGDQEIALGPPQRRAVLAVLLLRAGTVVPADELLDAVSEGAPPASGLRLIRTHVSALRRALDPDLPARSPGGVLTGSDGGYRLTVAPSQVDVTVFEQQVADARDADPGRRVALLRDALAQWGGTPLAGLPGPYAATQRTRLIERRQAVDEDRLAVEASDGDPATAAAELAVLVAEHPLRERPIALLMRALHRAGRGAEAMDVYAAARRALVDELGVEPGEAMRDAHRALLDAVDDHAPTPAASTRRPSTTVGRPGRIGARPTAPAMPTPAQLPPDVPKLVGRDRELRVLRAALTVDDPGAGVPVCIVTGPGGAGKTALAVHAAHRVADRFPGGQVHVDLRGTDETPADPMAVQASVLRSLGVAVGDVPADSTARTMLYRSTLAHRRVLVVLDDAANSDQVWPLLPGSGSSAAVLTSRHTLGDIPTRARATLRVLGVEDAVALVRTVTGDDRVTAEPEAAIELVTVCGLLPLAVRIAAARLASRPLWTITAFTERLRDERDRFGQLRVGESGVAASLRLSFRHLPVEAARAFRLLAVPDWRRIPLAAAAAMLDRPDSELEPLLESLVDTHLLDSPGPGRYAYHDLLRLFARQEAAHADDEADRTAALRRLLDYYLRTATAALAARFPGELPAPRAAEPIPDPDEAIRWLADEHGALFALVEQAARHRNIPVSGAADLLAALGAFSEAGEHWEAMTSAARSVAAGARAAADPGSEARALRELGLVLGYRRELVEADDVLTRAAVLCQQAGDGRLLVDVLASAGMVAARLGDQERAFALSRDALEAARAADDRGREAMLLADLCLTAGRLGRIDEAVEYGERSLAMRTEQGNVLGRAHALYALGVAARHGGDPVGAARLHERSAELFGSRNHHFRQVHALLQLARDLLDAGRPVEALSQAASQAVAVATASGDAALRAEAAGVLDDLRRDAQALTRS